jgi:hypothetical protein
MARKPKDRSAYFEEARELHRQFPSKRSHEIGDIMQRRHPADRGLGQAVRKRLRKEDKEAERLAHPAPPSPSVPSPPTARAKSRRRSQRAEEAVLKQIAEQAKLAKAVSKDVALMKQILEQEQKTWEALRSDPQFNELLRRIFEDDWSPILTNFPKLVGMFGKLVKMGDRGWSECSLDRSESGALIPTNELPFKPMKSTV